MNTHTDKTQENKSQSVANAVSQRQNSSQSTFQFVDNRPKAVAQRKLQEMANNYSQAKQVARLQAMYHSNDAKQQRTIQRRESNPADLVQRRMWDNVPTKFQTRNDEGAANSEYLVTESGYRRFAPEAIAQRKLQEMANNRPQAGQAASVIQRMVLPVWANKEDEETFLDQGKQQSEKMGHGKVINIGNYFTNKNLSGIEEYEDLHIIGHGNPATVAGMTPAMLAKYIINTLKLPIKYKGHIFLETCKSGTQIKELEGTYAERFIFELNKLRGEDAEQLTAIGFSGSVVLDTGYPSKETIRVLKEGITIEEFKERAVILIKDTVKIVDNFINDLKKNGLEYFINEQDILNLHFHIYNTKISKIAEPQGGKLTRLYVRGVEYESIPDQIPNIAEMMESITSAAQTQKNEVDDIPVLTLDDLFKEKSL